MAKFEARDEELQSTDYRAYFDSCCLRVWHLTGKDRTFKIVRVTRLTSEMANGNKREVKKQPKLELEDAKGQPVPLPLLLNKTNAKTIAQLYGNNPGQWAGKLITLYATTTDMAGQTVDCIRVRPKAPAKAEPRAAKPAVTVPALDHAEDMREPVQDDEEPPIGALETDHANQ
jgi:hypothetical protein